MSAPIVVGYCPHSADRGPVDFAVAAGRFAGAPVVVTSVHAGGSVLDRLSGGEFAEETDGADAAALEELRSEIEAQGVSATVRAVAHSTPARGLAHVVEEVQPGLLVLGSTRRGALGRVLPGSTAERVMHGAPCPVVVVPHGHAAPEGLRTIGAAFVPTPEGRDALGTAATIARATGARLRAILVLSPKLAERQAAGLLARQHREVGVSEEEAARHGLDAEGTLRDAIGELAADVDAEPDVLYQEPADGLTAASQTLDLLVMGSRAYGPMRAVMLGGVSRRVIASAGCPVLVLPRGSGSRLEPLLEAAGAGAG